MERLAKAGVAIADRHADPAIEEVEGAILSALALKRTINAGKVAGRSTRTAIVTPTICENAVWVPVPSSTFPLNKVMLPW